MILAELNQEQTENLNHMTAILPIGATEVHGNHLPVGTDIFLAENVAKKLELRLGTENALLLPVISYGQVWSLEKAPGSVHIPEDILSEYIYYIGKSVINMGIKKLAIVNSHVGNLGAIKTAARKLSVDNSIKTYYFTYPGSEKVIQEVCEAPAPHKGYFHACEIETSYMLYLCPDKVDMTKAICQYPEFPEEFDYTPIKWTDLMKTAVLGDATKATAEKGQKIIEVSIDRMAKILMEDSK